MLGYLDTRTDTDRQRNQKARSESMQMGHQIWQNPGHLGISTAGVLNLCRWSVPAEGERTVWKNRGARPDFARRTQKIQSAEPPR